MPTDVYRDFRRIPAITHSCCRHFLASGRTHVVFDADRRWLPTATDGECLSLCRGDEQCEFVSTAPNSNLSRTSRRCMHCTSCRAALSKRQVESNWPGAGFSAALKYRSWQRLHASKWECVLPGQDPCESASQGHEDVALLPLLKHVAQNGPGSFVEIGAFDGTTYSNSLMVERCHGWRGLLVEANPSNFAKLNASGRASTTLHSAVCARGQRSVRVSIDGGVTAGVLSRLTKRRQATRIAEQSRAEQSRP
jgi:hypothetical protein